jgi:APA family basic amino acid/polyamine antiporter
MLGFLTGWISFFVGFSAPLAASSLGFSEYFASAFPALGLAENSVMWKKAIALLVIIALASVHLRGMAFGARIQNYLTVGKVVLIVGFVIAGFVLGNGDTTNFYSRTTPDAPAANWRVIGLALMWIMFAYSGWNAAGYIGSEIREPRRNLPLSLILGTGIVMLLYLGLNAVFVYAVAPADMQGVIAVGGLAASNLFGATAERLVSLLIAFALLSAISALIIVGPRVYYAMAKDGYFFKRVARVHPVHRVPSTAILLQCGIASVMVATGTFDQILTYMGFCLGIFPILAVLGVFKLKHDSGGTLKYMSYRVAAVIFAATSLGILVLAYFERPVESSIALLTVAAGIPFYLSFAKAKREATSHDMRQGAKERG